MKSWNLTCNIVKAIVYMNCHNMFMITIIQTWYDMSYSYLVACCHSRTITTNQILKINENWIWKIIKKSENNIFKLFFKICQIQTKSFYIFTWKQNHEIFAIIMKNIENFFKLKSYTDLWLIVFEKYHDLINVFEKQNVNKLFSY